MGDLDRIVQLLEQILAREDARLAAPTPLPIRLTAQGQAPQVQPVLPLPISPLTLLHMATAAGVPGVSVPLAIRQAVSVPAGGSTTVTFPAPEGQVMVLGAPFQLFSTLHDPNLLATVVVDGTNVIVESYPIVADVQLSLPQYGSVRDNVTSTFINNTTAPAIITPDAQVVLVDALVYDDVWRTLFKGDYGFINSYAALLAKAGVA